MNAFHMKLLAAVAVILAAVAYFVSAQGGKSPTSQARYLLGDIDSRRIAAISLEKGEESIELKLEGSNWTVPEAGGYPADTNKVRSLLLKLLDLSSSQSIPASEEGLKKLGLSEESVEAGSGRVRLLDKSGELLGGLLLGERRMKEPQGPGQGAPAAASGQYVRRLGEDNVYLVGLPVTLTLSSTHWLDTELVNVREGSVHSVAQYVLADGERTEQFAFERMAGEQGELGPLELNTPPEEGKVLQESTASQVRSALESVKLEDIKKRSEVEEKPAFDQETVFQLRSGLVYTVRTAQENDKTLAEVTVEFEEALMEQLKAQHEERKRLVESRKSEEGSAAGEQTGEESGGSKSDADGEEDGDGEEDDAAEAKEAAELEEPMFSSAGEASKLMERFKPWIFVLPDYQGKKFRYSRSDLLTDEEQPPPETSAEAAGSEA